MSKFDFQNKLFLKMKLNYKVFFIAIAILLISCNKKSSNDSVQPRGFDVRLDLKGEIFNIDGGSPLLMAVPYATENSLYGVQVYARKDSPGTTYSPYALGIFDDPSLINITLYERSLYKFAITKIVDGKDILPLTTSNTYRAPLLVTGGIGCSGHLSNKMTVSGSCELSGLGVGSTSLVIGESVPKAYARPNVDRYYGELSDFRPTSSTLTPAVDMKRVVFGVDFLVEGLTEGHLDIAIDGAPTIIFEYDKAKTASHIFTLNGAMGDNIAWTRDNYTETVPVSIKWYQDGGNIVNIATKNLTFKRKYKYNMTVKLSLLSFDNGAVITTESSELIDGEDIMIQ